MGLDSGFVGLDGLRGCWLFVSFVWIDDLRDFGWLFVYRLALIGVWVCCFWFVSWMVACVYVLIVLVFDSCICIVLRGTCGFSLLVIWVLFTGCCFGCGLCFWFDLVGCGLGLCYGWSLSVF